MRTTNTLATLGWAAWIALAAPLAWAGDGHDHGEAPAATAGPASPRFTATSETFELVGVVNGKQLTLYLDRYADGSPVKDAKLELELGGVKVPVEPHAGESSRQRWRRNSSRGLYRSRRPSWPARKPTCWRANLTSMKRRMPKRPPTPMAGRNTPCGPVPPAGGCCSLPHYCAACALPATRVSEVPHEAPSVIERPLSFLLLVFFKSGAGLSALIEY